MVCDGGVRGQSAGVRAQRRARFDDPRQCPQVRERCDGVVVRGQPAQSGRLQKSQLHSIALERLDFDEICFPPAGYRLSSFDPTLCLRDDDDPPRALGLFAVAQKDGLKQLADDDEFAGLDAFRRVDHQHVLRIHCGV